jgi:hypothetical protein
MPHKNYPKLGGDLDSACQRLGKGLDAIGVVAVLYRGMNEKAEMCITFAPGVNIKPEEFRKLMNAILEDTYSTSIAKTNKGCVMLAEATNSECVILFVIKKDGSVLVNVSEPKPNEFVAAFALQVANGFDAMN